MDSARAGRLMKRDTKNKIGSVKLPPIESLSSDIKTIVDIDPDYYSLVQGRPIRPNNSINKYKEDIKQIARKRTIIGFVIDEIGRIDKEIEIERSIFQTASKYFEECQHSFNKFLAHDNDKTIVIMKKSDTLAKNLMNETEEQKKVKFELASIKSKLQYIEETLLILLSLENFLHKASPIIWQESENVKLDIKHPQFISTEINIFENIDIEEIRQKLSNLPSPKLYFKKPEELINVFELMEMQNLDYLLVTEQLSQEKSKFLKAKNNLKALMLNDLDQVQQKMKEIEEATSWNENREVELKEIFYKILEEKIKYLVSSDTALQIFNYVEFAYIKLIAPNDTNLSTLNMALALETEFDNLMLEISVFDLDMIKAIEKETYQNAIKEIKQAKEASKLLKDIDKLNRHLKSAFERPRV